MLRIAFMPKLVTQFNFAQNGEMYLAVSNTRCTFTKTTCRNTGLQPVNAGMVGANELAGFEQMNRI